MVKSGSTCKIDGVMVGEVELNLLGHTAVMNAKYALVNSNTGDRMGLGHRNVWSEATVLKVKEMIESMEKDICKDIFTGGATIGSVVEPIDDTTDGVPGL